MRMIGVNLPDEKRIDIALSYVYGLGRNNVKKVLSVADIDPAKRAKTLTEEEIKRVTKVLETYKLEGDLRAEVQGNIRRLKDIGAYVGIRHSHNLPAHGQRTRSNARTKRGKRMTIGAIKKEIAERMEKAKTAQAKATK
jgi:small subunit ribosomal protein S13